MLQSGEADIGIATEAIATGPDLATPGGHRSFVRPTRKETGGRAAARRDALSRGRPRGCQSSLIRARLPAGAVVRAMPNTPAAVGQGATALFTRDGDIVQGAAGTGLVNAIVATRVGADLVATSLLTADSPSTVDIVFADDAGLSRIYGGIHYPVDEATGSAMGKSLAATVSRSSRQAWWTWRRACASPATSTSACSKASWPQPLPAA